MKKNYVLKFVVMVVLGIALFQVDADAEEFNFVGARANGMGGANAVSTHDASAQYHNPAAFGFMSRETETEDIENTGLGRRKWGWSLLNGGIGAEIGGELGRYLGNLADINLDLLEDNDLNDPQNVRSLVELAGSINGLDDPGNDIRVTTNAGSSIRIGRFAIGVRGFGEFVGNVEQLDTTNLGLDHANIADLVGEIDDAITAANFDANGYQFQFLNNDQQMRLTNALGANSGNAVKFIDKNLSDLLADDSLEAIDIESTVSILEDIADDIGNPTSNIDNNLTTVIGRGFSLAEIPISYGHAINDNLSLGITGKLMHGSVIGTRISVFDDDNEDFLEDIDDQTEETLTFGIDVGVLYRIPNFQFAVVGHNLNKPSFDGFTQNVTFTTQGGQTQTSLLVVKDVDIDPQITLGAAFVPSERFTLEINYDALETGTLAPNRDIQNLSAGVELDLKLLALRAGVYKNLAANDGLDDPVVTAGIGFNAWLLRIDAGGAASIGDTVEYDGTDYPQVARAYVGISMDF